MGNSIINYTNACKEEAQLICDENHLIMEPFHYEFQQIAVEPIITRKGVTVIAKGNLHFIVGPTKTFKSTIAGKLMSAALGAEPEDVLGFEKAVENCNVLHVDTEQDSGDLRELAIRILADAGLTSTEQHAEYKVYDMMQYSAYESLDLTLRLIQTSKPDLVIIDGLVDLVDDFNSLIESKNVIHQLQAAAKINRCAIICVLHYNPFSKKSRGHLGTILMQKAWGGIAINRLPWGIEVSNEGLTRRKSIEKFQICYNATDETIIECGSVFDSGTKEKEKAEQDNFIESLFNTEFELSHSDIMRKLMTKYSIESKNKTKANRMIDHAVKSGLIIKGDNGRYTITDLPALFSNECNNNDDDDNENEYE